MTLNCIAIDDEPLALGLVTSFIKQTPFLNLVNGYSSAVDALRSISGQKVDLIFLDIQMPDLNGIELARLLHQGNNQTSTRLIFTTAFNHFALDGYRVDALDYLLKPFNYEEFLRAAKKALDYFTLIHNPPQVAPAASPYPDDYLFVKVEYQLVKIAFGDILYIERLKDYAKIHLTSQDKALSVKIYDFYKNTPIKL